MVIVVRCHIIRLSFFVYHAVLSIVEIQTDSQFLLCASIFSSQILCGGGVLVVILDGIDDVENIVKPLSLK